MASLPNALLIGDSICAGYTPWVQAALVGAIDVVAIPENGKDSQTVLERWQRWVGDNYYTIIHVNCGLHDLKRLPNDGSFHVPMAAYEENLRAIVHVLRPHAKGLIWARTTPIIDELHNTAKRFKRFNCDVVAYNHAADRVMAELHIPTSDLHAAIAGAELKGFLSPDGIHLTDDGYRRLGRCVATAIRASVSTMTF